jgi:hypothetical protein
MAASCILHPASSLNTYYYYSHVVSTRSNAKLDVFEMPDAPLFQCIEYHENACAIQPNRTEEDQ